MRFAQRAAGLSQNPHHPLGRQRPMRIHQRHEVHPVEQFHHKIETARLAYSKVVKSYCVRRAQMSDRLGLASEALSNGLAATLSEHVGPDQLDRTLARQQLVS